MKYKVAAVIIALTLIIGLGIFEQIFIKTTFEEFNSRLDSFIVEEDETYDLKQIKETQEWWKKRHKYLDLFLQHNHLIVISITYGYLVGAVAAEDFDSAQALLNRIRQTGEEFEDMYALRIGNII